MDVRSRPRGNAARGLGFVESLESRTLLSGGGEATAAVATRPLAVEKVTEKRAKAERKSRLDVAISPTSFEAAVAASTPASISVSAAEGQQLGVAAKVVLTGDANGDGRVDAADVKIV